jgi:1-acyl-sn-glycerol-3-phosphate acyltransferase
MADIVLRCIELLLRTAFKKRVLLNESEEYIHRAWRSTFRKSRASLYVSGDEHVDKNQSYVLMSNHRSHMDIPSLALASPFPVRMVTKQELFAIPFFGPTLRKTGFIPIDRKNRSLAIAQLNAAKSTLERGVSVWVAPQGTRSSDQTLGPFKKGGFHLAISIGLPILPVWIEGSDHVIPTREVTIIPNQSIRVFFGEPISTQGLRESDIPALMETVRSRLETLHQMATNAVPQ